MSNLANIARALNPNITRNELKVLRAKLRRAGLTGRPAHTRGEYTVNTSSDVATDARCAEGGTVIVAFVAEAA